MSVTKTFDVTVAANRSPAADQAIAGLSLEVAGGAHSTDISDAFEDVDGDALTYGASSSDESVATVQVTTTGTDAMVTDSPPRRPAKAWRPRWSSTRRWS